MPADPDSAALQNDQIARDLTRVLTDPATPRRELDVRTPHRFAILSDQHKGARDRADAFPQCEAAYRAALTSYRERGFTLILLGDVEELWEQGWSTVLRHYEDLIRFEASFGPDRYVRVFGNHDDDWMDPKLVTKRLAPLLPVPVVYEGLRFDMRDGDRSIGMLFLVHGHQGTLFSQKWCGLSRFFLRIWRPLQRIFGFQVRTPSTDPCLRGDHDRAMYEWAAAQTKVILIAGHTHRPVWSSRTHLQKLEAERAALQATGDPADPTYVRGLASLDAQIARRRVEHPPCRDTVKTVPAYFNTGCCIFDDGDITGMELEDGMLRLVKWPAGGEEPVVVLEEERVKVLFERLELEIGY
jgi:hypothetical protein